MDTKALRQKILDLAIRGKLVPQDPNDEPASVLLERICQQKQQMVKDMTALASLDLLKPGAKIVVETDEQTDLPPVAGFDLLKDHHMGKTIVRIYQRAE
mgnify:CR=1 FL=1